MIARANPEGRPERGELMDAAGVTVANRATSPRRGPGGSSGSTC